ncbi:MAG TPA: hypothetical protein VI112_02410 [Bacteroidia bacterium]|jgi:hypothetical protein
MKKTALIFLLFAPHAWAQNNVNQAPPDQQTVIDVLDNQAPTDNEEENNAPGNNQQVIGPNGNEQNGTNGTTNYGNSQSNVQQQSGENNANTFRPFRGNVFQTRNPDGTPLDGSKINPTSNQPKGDNNSNKDNNTNNNGNVNDDPPKDGKKPYCKECEELKRLKRLQDQQNNSGYVPTGHKKKQAFAHFCIRMNKKMRKVFAKDKRKRPNYSCFNW